MNKKNDFDAGLASIDQRNILLISLLMVAIGTLLCAALGLDRLLLTAWAFGMIAIFSLLRATLWMLKNPESYPWSASIPMRARGHLILSTFLSAIVVFLDRSKVFTLSLVWFALLQVVLLAILVSQSLFLGGANRRIHSVENEGKEKRNHLSQLQITLEQMAQQVEDSELKDALKKLAEEFRFSDPISSDALASIEQNLVRTVDELKKAVQEKDVSQARALVKQAALLLEERNQKCLAFKS